MNLASDGKCFGMSEKRAFTLIALAILIVASVFGVNTNQVFQALDKVQQLEDMLTEEWNPTWYALQQPYSYVISKISTYYCAQNGTTGKLDIRSTNATYVINSAFGNCSAGGTIMFKDFNYTTTATLLIPDLENMAGFTMIGEGGKVNITSSGSIGTMLDYVGTSYIQGANCPRVNIEGFQFRFDSQSDSDVGLDLSYTIPNLRDITVSNIGTDYQATGILIDVESVNNPASAVWDNVAVGSFRVGYNLEFDHLTGINLMTSQVGNSSSTAYDWNLHGDHITLINPHSYKQTEAARIFAFSRYGKSYTIINPIFEGTSASSQGFRTFSGTYTDRIVEVYDLYLASTWAGTIIPVTTDYQYIGFHNGDHLTENSGTAEFSSNTTTTFSHDIAGTPTLVLCSFNTTGWTSWAWSATSTQITITVETSGTYKAYWYAEYKP